MRILVMNWKDLAHPAAGGAEVFTHEVTRRWAAWGHEVTLFCAAADGRPTTERIERVRVVRRGSRWTVYREARLFYRREGR
ncbi:MAG: glycosyltransferase, partial [Acidimicrobiia bacterium]